MVPDTFSGSRILLHAGCFLLDLFDLRYERVVYFRCQQRQRGCYGRQRLHLDGWQQRRMDHYHFRRQRDGQRHGDLLGRV